MECISDHVREAITLNKERKKLYRDHHGKKVSQLFSRFILVEKLMIPFTKADDRRSQPYREAGVPLFCRELSPVSTTPAFEIVQPLASMNGKIFTSLEVKEIQNAIRSHLSDETYPYYPRTRNFIISKIKELEKFPNQQCLMRHFLESLAATLREITSYDQEIRQSNLSGGEKLFFKYFKNQLKALPFMGYFDRKGFPYQLRGIGIFCQDMPPIHY